MKKKFFVMASVLFAALAVLVSCSEDKETSELPVFGELSLSPTTVAPGDTVTGTVTFKSPGKYVKGTYSYTTTPSLVGGTFQCGSSSDVATFKFVIPEAKEDDAKEQEYVLTLSATSMAAYAGDKPYIDPAGMGKLEGKFKVVR